MYSTRQWSYFVSCTPTDAGIVFQATVAILLGIFVPMIIGVVIVLSLLILLYYHHQAKHLDSKIKDKELGKTIDRAEKQLANKDNSKEVILKLLDMLLKAMESNGHIADDGGDQTDSPPWVKEEFSFSGSSCNEEGLNSEVVVRPWRSLLRL